MVHVIFSMFNAKDKNNFFITIKILLSTKHMKLYLAKLKNVIGYFIFSLHPA